MEPRFDPKDVRTPIQLTAAWFVTLAALVGALLTASNRAGDAWLRGFFGIAAVAVIPIFVVAVFRLQTKYRPQLLADEYFVQVEQQVQAAATKRGIALPPAQPELIARRAARNYRALVGASILWVDDDPASVRQEQQLLRTLGVAHIDTVTSTHHAIEQVARRDYDVVISDMERDGDDSAGIQLLEELGAGAPPVIIYLYDLDRERGVPGGAFGITNRPDELVNLVLDALERSRS